MIKRFNEYEKLNEDILPISEKPKDFIKVYLDDKVGINIKDSSDRSGLALLGYAAKFALKKGYTMEELKELFDDMQSGDYEHLIGVFDKHFGDQVNLYR